MNVSPPPHNNKYCHLQNYWTFSFRITLYTHLFIARVILATVQNCQRDTQLQLNYQERLSIGGQIAENVRNKNTQIHNF